MGPYQVVIVSQKLGSRILVEIGHELLNLIDVVKQFWLSVRGKILALCSWKNAWTLLHLKFPQLLTRFNFTL